MKISNLILLALLLFIFSCGGSESTNKETYKDVANEATNSENNSKEVKSEKNYEKLIIGSWYNSATVSGEDLVFNSNGTFDYHSGNVVDNGNWTLEGEYLTFYSVKYKIVDLTEKILVIEDDLGKTIYERMN